MKVLLQYLDSRKVREVTNNTDLHTIVQETFSLEEQTYILQKFDEDFNDYFDWEDLTDLNDKDKFKVVVKVLQNSNLQTQSLTLDSCSAEEIAESAVQDVITLPLRLQQWPHKVVLQFGNFSSSLKEELAAGKWLNWERSR
ncbi:hypothetical protein JTE90_003840 [Oedothorax gibbosus]|uniref:Uncharacterized protein n=1 Tax=Oedothorax gibbosus TaxID=931172 RepID=A0AAV6TLC2_9ARAC|nr:hypothetical protein JTE90_003840 [Oedothorax gibbosus]